MKDIIESIIKDVNKKTIELEQKLSSSNLDIEQLREFSVEYSRLKEALEIYQQLKQVEEEMNFWQEAMKEDPSLEEDFLKARKQYEDIISQLISHLLPFEEHNNVIFEIRAGTGGEEAALFAADLYRMYIRYAERKGWQVELSDFHDTGLGGFKEIVFFVKGKSAYKYLKYESGVHRVQRVPVTESSGRIHTSTATVAVLPEVSDVEIHIDPKDLKIDTFKASGHGGQYVNKTESAVRITHLPTGIIVSCQSERSQHQNRERALVILRAKLYEIEQEKINSQLSNQRKNQIGSAERSEKIRTYNFPQNRVTDHRINYTTYRLQEILDGDLDELIMKLFESELIKLTRN
ncbi:MULTISPECIES: peptide chain release factor 1 [Pseudothermotoga]|uniref:Peptide chain release factor 1 n=1 Tax=Pseudothermotoga lettingae (strain ATCC BAA-301 / DSM 14385 / NBRC 107922 / TMO) TaxID=416591 RepID=A8F463_PSELT|nr:MULTISPECIES: peptide chain release factor 1 [Pseudothermotoga]ABV32947.1 peptide chain release factor 1 [Pseudothermotoga lettingae TMO]MDK2883952.1 peptide chain release factor 1 [Pseudothermotoga sp.]GLI48052.1 peptide chain release factor 1 [Pseudothermotoga lettingae TMO]HBJ82254.1 peptide chain release factor 1 [Pseudothermotoga sp.]